MIDLERPKGMWRKEWANVLADRARAAAPQFHIIWFYRGQALQWVRAPDYRSGVMRGCESIVDDLQWRGAYRAKVDAMHWAYNPDQDPPNGWLRATPDDLLNMEPRDD